MWTDKDNIAFKIGVCIEVVLYVQNSSQIHSPWLGDKVDSGRGLSYRAPAHQGNPMPESTISLSQDYEFG